MVQRYFRKCRLPEFGPGSTRSASTCRALSQGVPIDEIVAKAGWTNTRTFLRNYLRPISHSAHRGLVVQSENLKEMRQDKTNKRVVHSEVEGVSKNKNLIDNRLIITHATTAKRDRRVSNKLYVPNEVGDWNQSRKKNIPRREICHTHNSNLRVNKCQISHAQQKQRRSLSREVGISKRSTSATAGKNDKINRSNLKPVQAPHSKQIEVSRSNKPAK